MPTDALTLAEAARIMREAVKDKSYRATPMGGEAGHYLRWKRHQLTPDSYRDYEACLDKLARFFPDLEIGDFEPPLGTERLEEFLEFQWGHRAPRTYGKNLSVLKNFFLFATMKGKLHGNPAAPMVAPKRRGVHREIFSRDQENAIIDSQPRLRDKLACRILFHTGIRKGALLKIQFKHFDFAAKRVTIFTKGQKVRRIPIVDPLIWHELEQHILERAPKPDDYLLFPERRGYRGMVLEIRDAHPERPMTTTTGHRWWYRCLENAGLTEHGVTRGHKMHKARHTSGQRMLDRTGNLKAVQSLLGHESIQTTGDIYTDWGIDQLAQSMRDTMEEGT